MTNTLNELTQYAHKAILYEVILSPKPGLVDRINSGSHDDMDIFTFIDAINSLLPYFKGYLDLGWQHPETASPKELFLKARALGIEAEYSMMQATNGVNTHKGANFSFAVILSASAYIIKEKRLQLPLKEKDTEQVFQYVAKMCEGLVTIDFNDLDQKNHLSYGETLYLEYDITGIRGVAEEGYPILTNIMLPYLRENLKKYPNNLEGVLLHCLALTMSAAEDTNLIHRGGMKSYQEVRTEAKSIYEMNSPETIQEAFTAYDQQLIQRHLSPGGAADLLPLTIYIALLEGLL